MIYVMVNEMVFRVSKNELEVEDSWRYILRQHISYFADEHNIKGLLEHIGKRNPFYEHLIMLVNSFTPGNVRQPFKCWDHVEPDLRDLVGEVTSLEGLICRGDEKKTVSSLVPFLYPNFLRLTAFIIPNIKQ
jgi:hypothetical protein